MMRAGLYRPVHVKTLRSQKLRMLLTHRQLLQSKAIAVENDLRDLIEPLARLVGSVPGVDPTVELQDLRLEHPELGAERGETRTRNLGHPFVTWIGDDREQFLDTIASDWRDDPELCKMGADRIDHRGLLANEQMACDGASGSSAARASWSPQPRWTRLPSPRCSRT